MPHRSNSQPRVRRGAALSTELRGHERIVPEPCDQQMCFGLSADSTLWKNCGNSTLILNKEHHKRLLHLSALSLLTATVGIRVLPTTDGTELATGNGVDSARDESEHKREREIILASAVAMPC